MIVLSRPCLRRQITGQFDIDNSLLNDVVFIDLTEAFNATDHKIILRKMSLLGVNQAFIRWFLSYLGGRTQRCNVNGKQSTARDLRRGLPQSSILVPLLFLIYVNDLPNCMRAAAPRMFADVTNITLPAKTLTDLKQALSPELSNLSCWLKANKCYQNRVNDNVEEISKKVSSAIGALKRVRSSIAKEPDIQIYNASILSHLDHCSPVGAFSVVT